MFYLMYFDPQKQKEGIDNKIELKELNYNYSDGNLSHKLYYFDGNKVAMDTLNLFGNPVKRDYFKNENGKTYATSLFDRCGNLISTSYYDNSGNMTGSVIPHLSPVCTVTGL